MEGKCAPLPGLVTEILAEQLAGVAVIGFGDKPGKANASTQADANAVTTPLSEISTALRAASRPTLPN